jgi:heme-degrading monooxygenase HmoA
MSGDGRAVRSSVALIDPLDRTETPYLDIAAALRTELCAIDGFVSIERFQSLGDPRKLLSLSFWRDEEAHRGAQIAGREALFADYRLRVASVVRDYGLRDRGEAPEDSRAIHG